MALAAPSVKPLSRFFLGHDSAIKASFMALAAPSVLQFFLSPFNGLILIRYLRVDFALESHGAFGGVGELNALHRGVIDE